MRAENPPSLPDKPVKYSHPFPGSGVASGSEEVAVACFGDQLTVIDLASGKTLANIKRRCRPLAVSRGRLVAWESVGESHTAMRVLVYDLEDTNAPKLVSKPIIFPGWLDATHLSVENLRVTLGDDLLTIEWKAQSGYSGGAPPSEKLASQLSRAARGKVSVDLRTGAIEAPYELTPSDDAMSDDSGVVDYEFGMSWSDRPWIEANRRVAVVSESSGEDHKLMLKKMHMGVKGASAERIVLGIGAKPKATVTGDHGHVLIRDEAARAQQWRLYRADTGAQMAVLPYEPAARDAQVLGRTLYYVVANPTYGEGAVVLKARSIESGSLLWEKSFAGSRGKVFPESLPQRS